MHAKQVPAGFNTVTPFLVVNNPQQEIDFLIAALGAQIQESFAADNKIFHCRLLIGNSLVLLGDANPGSPPLSSMLYIYTPDVDAAFKRALAAGGQKVTEPSDMFYGDRAAGFKDPAGNFWWLATHIEDVSHDETVKRYEKTMRQAARS